MIFSVASSWHLFLSFLLIFIFLEMSRALELGHPYQGDAIGLAMMAGAAYGLALLSCAIGLVYFVVARIRDGFHLKVWQWAIGAYSLVQVIVPFVYFSIA